LEQPAVFLEISRVLAKAGRIAEPLPRDLVSDLYRALTSIDRFEPSAEVEAEEKTLLREALLNLLQVPLKLKNFEE